MEQKVLVLNKIKILEFFWENFFGKLDFFDFLVFCKKLSRTQKNKNWKKMKKIFLLAFSSLLYLYEEDLLLVYDLKNL